MEMNRPLSLAAGALLASAAFANGPVDSFRLLSHFDVPLGGNAEIVAATPDGNEVLYVNFNLSKIGVVDISDPARPELITEIPLPGEPTSVAITPDGAFALATLRTAKFVVGQPPDITPGKLSFIDLSTNTIVASIDIGEQPDSVAVARIAGQTVAVIAVENEPIVVDASGNFIGGDAPGTPGDIGPKGFIEVVVVDESDFSRSQISEIRFDDAAVLTALGLPFPNDPQPEFAAIHGSRAAVTLQENNAVAVLDLADPFHPVLERLFSLGVASNRLADLKNDATISLTQEFPADVPATAPTKALAGTRMPDGIAWNAAGTMLLTADEGEVNFAGTRGFSAFRPDGTFLWDDQGLTEARAAAIGQYPQARSSARGVELEGIDTGLFGSREFAFVGSERGGFLAVYDITNPLAPTFVQLLPTGLRPEGVLAIPQRGLVLSADEGDGGPGTFSIFEGVAGPFVAPPSRPRLISSGDSQPFAALSGLAADPSNSSILYAVPDNALLSTIFRIEVKGSDAQVSRLVPVTLNGTQAKYDLEGIAVDTSIAAPPNRGFWLASEGNGAFGATSYVPNLLVQVDGTGAVLQEIRLPEWIDPPAKIVPPDTTAGKVGQWGFEGVTISGDGRYVLACLQRELLSEPPVDGALHARIARYDLVNSSWELFLYPLEATSIPGDFLSLSEITHLGRDNYAVIERDKGVGAYAVIKRVYAFRLDGVAPFPGAVAADSDLTGHVLQKSLLLDVRDDFAPFEKVEGLALARGNTLYLCLDNDGGTVESRFLRASLPGESFELSFTGPSSVILGPAEPAQASCFATLSHSGYGSGAQAWSFGVSAENAEIVSLGLDGTDAGALIDPAGGFQFSELVPGGAVSAVVLSFVDSRALPPSATSTIAAMELDIPAPPPSNPAPPAVLRYVDGLHGSGEPILTSVVEEEARFTPSQMPLTIELILQTGIPFIRGDTNSDARVELVDAVRIFGYLFRGNPSFLSCLDAADANDTEGIDIADGIYILLHLFLGGAEPPHPFPSCGFDRGVGALDCESYAACP